MTLRVAADLRLASPDESAHAAEAEPGASRQGTQLAA